MALYEIFEDSIGFWRWRLVADNGEIVAASEAYSDESNARRGAEDAARISAEAIVQPPAELEPEPDPEEIPDAAA